MLVYTPRYQPGFGLRPRTPDRRDRALYAAVPNVDALPDKADCSHLLPQPMDQHMTSCHDEATEVLTSEGWKPWRDYTGNVALGTVNPSSGALEFQYPTALHRNEYRGEMVRGSHQSLDFCVTPNHRMYLRKWNEAARTLESNYRFVKAADIGWYAGLMGAPKGWLGTRIGSVEIGADSIKGDDFVALLGVIISDGYVSFSNLNPHRVGFCCFNESRYPAIAELAKRMGFVEQPSRKGVWYCRAPDLALWLRAHAYQGGAGARFKRVPSLVKEMAPDQIAIFLEFFGDRSSRLDGRRYFFSSSRGLIDDLQELLLRLGRRGSIIARKASDVLMKDGRCIKAENCATPYMLSEWQTDFHSISRKQAISREPYEGMVYCATVPNSTIVTRRNNHVLISGNSCVGFSAATVMHAIMVRDGHRRPLRRCRAAAGAGVLPPRHATRHPPVPCGRLAGAAWLCRVPEPVRSGRAAALSRAEPAAGRA